MRGGVGGNPGGFKNRCQTLAVKHGRSDLADLYRAMGRCGRRGGILSSANGHEHAGATPLFRLSIALGDGLASAADTMINSMAEKSLQSCWLYFPLCEFLCEYLSIINNPYISLS